MYSGKGKKDNSEKDVVGWRGFGKWSNLLSMCWVSLEARAHKHILRSVSKAGNPFKQCPSLIFTLQWDAHSF
jgi:hypothetical protein